MRVSTNKAIELIMFKGGWPCMFDLMTNWTLKGEEDHWGFKFCLVVLNVKLLEFNFYDTRHIEDEDE
jgi:hypothetical protein